MSVTHAELSAFTRARFSRRSRCARPGWHVAGPSGDSPITLCYNPSVHPKLTDEMRLALAAHPGSPIPVCDDQSQQLYVLVPRDQFAQLQDDYVRRELQIAFEQADRGEWEELDIEAVISEARAAHNDSRGAAS